MIEISTTEDFYSAIGIFDRVIVIFHANKWCADCIQFQPILKKFDTYIFNTYISTSPLCNVDIDVHPDIAKERQIKSVPTTIFFKDKVEYQRIVGKQTLEYLIGEFTAIYGIDNV